MDSLPTLNESRKFSEAEALPYTATLINMLKNNDVLEDENLLKNLIWRMSNLIIYRNFLAKVCQCLIDNDFGNISDTIFTFLIKNNKLESPLTTDILNVLVNFTAVDLSFSSHILSTAIFETLVDFCIDNENEIFLSVKSKNKCAYLVIKVIHNVLYYRENLFDYKVDSFKSALLKYISFSDSEDLGKLSILTLSYIIADDEVSVLDAASNVVGFLINNFKEFSLVNTRSAGFTKEGLLNGLRCISVNDNMKERISQEGGVELLLSILEGDYDIKEKELAFEILHNLCFNKSIKEFLKNEHKIEVVIGKFSESESRKIKEHYEGIMFLLRDKLGPKESTKSSKLLKSGGDIECVFDVFISYQRDYKEIIQKIKSEMLNSKLKVWLDDEQMIGSVLEAMALGIERSRVVLIAISKSYAESPNCRLEAEYAMQLQKPIVPLVMQYKYKAKSWLGMIRGMKMYYEFSERNDPNKLMSDVVKGIHTIIDKRNVGEDFEEKESKDSAQKEETCNKNERIRHLSREEVSQWLNEYQLGHLRKSFSLIDGTLLLVLISFRNTSLKYFNATLTKEFKMKFIDVLKFHNAVNNLMTEK